MEGDGNSELVAMFTSRWPLDAPTSPKGQLRVALASAAKTGAAAWPTIALWSERFVGYLTERADASRAPLDAIATLQVADLYLACACAGGDEVAVDTFLALYGPKLRRVIEEVDPAPGFVDEVMDELREALLGGEAEQREGKIAQYRGRVPLAAWLEASARRRALTRQGAARPFEDLAEIAGMERGGPPATDHLRLRYPNGFGQAVTDGAGRALAELSADDRALLRAHLVDGVSLRKLSHIRGVNVNLIARALAGARDTLRRYIREEVSRRAGLPPADAAAVMAALFTRINLGINAALKTMPLGTAP